MTSKTSATPQPEHVLRHLEAQRKAEQRGERPCVRRRGMTEQGSGRDKGENVQPEDPRVVGRLREELPDVEVDLAHANALKQGDREQTAAVERQVGSREPSRKPASREQSERRPAENGDDRAEQANARVRGRAVPEQPHHRPVDLVVADPREGDEHQSPDGHRQCGRSRSRHRNLQPGTEASPRQEAHCRDACKGPKQNRRRTSHRLTAHRRAPGARSSTMPEDMTAAGNDRATSVERMRL